MTTAKISVLTGGFIAVFAVGVASGPAIRAEWASMRSQTPAMAMPVPDATAATAEPSASPTPTSSHAGAVLATAKTSGMVRTAAVSEWRPELRARVKAVLNPGARLDLAAADFTTGEQFVTVAHAARDTQIPFVLLKDRVLNHDESLAEAIHQSKPGLDAKAEVTRARAAARADLSLAS